MMGQFHHKKKNVENLTTYLCNFPVGQSDICYAENKLNIVCDCTEPNVMCRGLNLTDMNYTLPDNTGKKV